MQGSDEYWMGRALELAERAAQAGEVPVGALLIGDGAMIAAGWNQSIARRDPSAHAEIVALRAAGQAADNYRLPGTVLYVTLEPCVMCAGALIQARIARLIYGAADPKAGAAGSVFDILPGDRLNHRISVHGGVMASQSRELLQAFFRQRRETDVGSRC